MDFEHRTDIAADPQTVWLELIDVERWPEWTTSMTRVQRLDDGPFGLGSQARIKQPRFPTLVWKVTAFTPGLGFTWATTGPGSRTEADHEIAPANGGTMVTLRIRQLGPLGRIVGRISRSLTRRYVTAEADGLKARCEEVT